MTATASATADPASTNLLTLPALHADQRTDLHCPHCQSVNVFDEFLDGETVCHDCGLVFDGAIFAEHSSNSSKHHLSNGHGYVRVNQVGRAYQSLRDLSRLGPSFAPTGKEQSRLYRAKRFEQIRQYMATAARQYELTVADVNRGYFLWKHAMAALRLRFWDPAARAALACLYLAAKEAKKSVSLIQVAVKAGMSPYKVGASFKLVKKTLLELMMLDADAPFFNQEDDPWVMMQKVMSIGAADSLQRGDLDDLSQVIQDALGVNMAPELRTACLRGLLAVTQKCMIVAQDSGLATGRHLSALVAACLAVAIEVRLLLTKCPEEVFKFVAVVFSSSWRTVIVRYNELRKCMLVWARRLPFMKGTDKIKNSQIVYLLVDVLQYFGHLKEQNRLLWDSLDKKDRDLTNNKNKVLDQLGPGGAITSDDLAIEAELVRDGTLWTFEQEEFSIDSEAVEEQSVNSVAATKQLKSDLAAQVLYPPAFLSSLQRTRRGFQNVEEARSQVAGTDTSFSPVQSIQVSSARKNKTRNQQDQNRIAMIRQLLEYGHHLEYELAEASDNTLVYWLTAASAEQAGLRTSRPSLQMDSTDLTEQDLDEAELATYLRSSSDATAVLKVMGPTYDLADRARQRTIKVQETRSARVKQQKEVRRQKRSSRPQTIHALSTLQQRPWKRKRSNKLNLEALSDLEDNYAADTNATVDAERETSIGSSQGGHETLNDYDGDDQEENGYLHGGHDDHDDFDDYNGDYDYE
ncbi:hypothetical protein EDD11_006450 [Mortierella claussenii]|nr:hypothetical protein EDD11_006450 [Mortierella claussenii]